MSTLKIDNLGEDNDILRTSNQTIMTGNVRSGDELSPTIPNIILRRNGKLLWKF